VITSPTLLGPVLVWRQQNYLELLLTMRHFDSSYGCCPCVLPHRKSGHDNECIGLEYSSCLFHTETRWLPKENLWNGVFLPAFNPTLTLLVADEIWLGKLAYLADIFNLLNQLRFASLLREEMRIFYLVKHKYQHS